MERRVHPTEERNTNNNITIDLSYILIFVVAGSLSPVENEVGVGREVSPGQKEARVKVSTVNVGQIVGTHQPGDSLLLGSLEGILIVLKIC